MKSPSLLTSITGKQTERNKYTHRYTLYDLDDINGDVQAVITAVPPYKIHLHKSYETITITGELP